MRLRRTSHRGSSLHRRLTGHCGTTPATFVVTDFLASFSEGACSRNQKIEPAASFAMFHCFRHLVTIGGPHIGCGLHHRAPALAPRGLRPTHVHRRRAVSSRALIQINILNRRLATAFLYSPQLRKSPMSPGIPPGNSRTRAASRKPCGLRSRSHRTYISDASLRNDAGQLGSPALTARPASFLAMEATLLESADGIGKSSAYPAVGIGKLHPGLRERSYKIGATDDVDDPAVTQHRNALDAVGGQQSRDFVDFGFPRQR